MQIYAFVEKNSGRVESYRDSCEGFSCSVRDGHLGNTLKYLGNIVFGLERSVKI